MTRDMVAVLFHILKIYFKLLLSGPHKMRTEAVPNTTLCFEDFIAANCVLLYVHG